MTGLSPSLSGHRLLGIGVERSHRFEREITIGHEGIKPGWVRVNFNYFISEPVFQYLLRAVELVAEHGWRFLPDYRFDAQTGLWRHKRGLVEPLLRLQELSYDTATGAIGATGGPRAGAGRLGRTSENDVRITHGSTA